MEGTIQGIVDCDPGSPYSCALTLWLVQTAFDPAVYHAARLLSWALATLRQLYRPLCSIVVRCTLRLVIHSAPCFPHSVRYRSTEVIERNRVGRHRNSWS
jgi:hypothetical protein